MSIQITFFIQKMKREVPFQFGTQLRAGILKLLVHHNFQFINKEQVNFQGIIPKSLNFYLRHYEPSPLQAVQREFH